ncbi:MAG: beta-glucosidase [Thermoprotei archaeon]|nr:MAG: beta-glucosidase [Thermoprotei archaeon]
MHVLRYSYCHAVASGVPLGGIGTGSLEIRADGRLHEWHIFNNGPWSSRDDDRKLKPMDLEDSFFALRVRKGDKVMVRILRASSYELGASPYRIPWVKPVDEILFEGRPPFAFLSFIDRKLEADVKLEAFSPFIPGDVRNSAIPVALFRFSVENRSSETIEATIVFALKNPFSGLGKEITGISEVKKEEKYTAIIMKGQNLSPLHPMKNGSLGLAVLSVEEVTATAYVKKDNMALERFWVDLRKDGCISGPERYEGKDVHYVALAKKLSIPAKGRGEVIFLVAWFFPNHLDEANERLGHMYENWFSSSEDVVKYVVENFEYLHNMTRSFYKRLYEDTTMEEWLCDIIGSQVSTLQKATWFTKEGRIGVWEGYYDPYYAGPTHAAFNTTDVMYYASVMLLFLFPELERKFIMQQAEWQLSPDIEPYYTLYALSIPENLDEFKKEIAKDPSLIADFDKVKKVVREIVKRTGKDPRGRVMHFFGFSLKRPDAYHMVDLMPKYILMSYRDALWMGDEKLLRSLWNKLKEEVECILRIHNKAEVKLPYHQTPAGFEAFMKISELLRNYGMLTQLGLPILYGETLLPIGFQTFDVWSFIGIAAYSSILWLSALKAMIKASEELLKDRAYAEKLKEIYDEAKSNLEKLLWNGEYFDLWYDPISGKRDKACMAAQLIGQWYASVLTDIGYAIDKEKVVKTLRSIAKYNIIEDEGLINGVYPNEKRPAYEGDLVYPNDTGLPYSVGCQMDTPWSGVEYAVASHMIHEGLVEEGMKILREIHERYMKGGHYWNHIEWGAHYMRPMSSWSVIVAIEGLLYDGIRGKLKVRPRLRKESFKWIFTLPGVWGNIEHKVIDKTLHLIITLDKGAFNVREVVVERLGTVGEVKVSIDGAVVQVKETKELDESVVVTLSEEVKVNRRLEVIVTYV